ncbi:hypothetical protein [Brevundimonas sp.]|uniref:hypothetical protein n=1 Tax=Brevundimonas sp. TaxID=1871086 RepID=UPI0028970FB8|nr:hypothetical protein [Brevundimonas sp.]
MNQTHVIERAFQIADENRACLKISDLHEALGREGYTTTDMMHLQGWSIREQLRARMKARIKLDERIIPAVGDGGATFR